MSNFLFENFLICEWCETWLKSIKSLMKIVIYTIKELTSPKIDPLHEPALDLLWFIEVQSPIIFSKGMIVTFLIFSINYFFCYIFSLCKGLLTVLKLRWVPGSKDWGVKPESLRRKSINDWWKIIDPSWYQIFNKYKF